MQTYPIENPSANWPADEYPQVGNYMTVKELRNLVEHGVLIPNEDALVRGVIIKDGFLCEIDLGWADPRSDVEKNTYPVVAYAVYEK